MNRSALVHDTLAISVHDLERERLWVVMENPMYAAFNANGADLSLLSPWNSAERSEWKKFEARSGNPNCATSETGKQELGHVEDLTDKGVSVWTMPKIITKTSERLLVFRNVGVPIFTRFNASDDALHRREAIHNNDVLNKVVNFTSKSKLMVAGSSRNMLDFIRDVPTVRSIDFKHKRCLDSGEISAHAKSKTTTNEVMWPQPMNNRGASTQE